MEDPELSLDVPLHYSPRFREYGIKILDGGSSNLRIHFCPWCGQKLPNSLRDEWYDELERIGIDPGADEIPEEFSEDTWWRKRFDSAPS